MNIKPDISVRKNGVMDTSFLKKLYKDTLRDRYLWLLIIPVLLYYIIFHYIPMYGVIISFKNFVPLKGIMGSPWVGFKWFFTFFQSVYFGRLLRNTVLISFYSLLWGFPIPIIFALLLNEVKTGLFKKSVQTISYLPHFISVVVTIGMVTNFLSPLDGIVNQIISMFGKDTINFLIEPRWFRTIYISTGVWQSFGWNSIIYLAAISSIDIQMYESAKIDGARRLQQTFYITLPTILPTIIILLILNLGNLMNVGFEKIILLYCPTTYEVADVISTYVYRRGILGAEYSFGAAVGLFNAAINLTLLVIINKLSKKVSSVALW